MKKNIRVKRIIVILLILIEISYISPFYEVKSEEKEENESVQEILKTQSDSVGISSFIKEANKYKSEDFDIDINEIMNSALKGNIDNEKMQKNILSILGKELEKSIRTIR